MTDQVDSQVKKHRSDLLIQDTKEYQKNYADASRQAVIDMIEDINRIF